MNSADVYHVLWISAGKRQNYETALFSADYLWNFNPGTNALYPFGKSNFNLIKYRGHMLYLYQ